MIDGLYKVAFSTQFGAGDGVADIRGGQVRGGDSAMFYRGVFTENGTKFSAKVKSARHSPGMLSVFGIDTANIVLDGVINGTTIDCQGTAAEAPGVTFKAHLTRISD